MSLKFPVGTLVRVLSAESSYKGLLSTVSQINGVNGNFYYLSHACGVVFEEKDLESVKEAQHVRVGDVVSIFGHTGPVTVTNYEGVNSKGVKFGFSKVALVSEEERVAIVNKRCEELNEKAAELLQESITLAATLVKTETNAAAPACSRP